jgi:hypothetical protein
MRLKIRIFLLFFFFISAPSTEAQTSFSRWIFGLNGGTIWGHNPPVYHLAQSHPIHAWAEYQMLRPEKDWVKDWKYPVWGFALKYMDFRNPVLGQSMVGIAYLEPKLFRRFTFRVGTGASIQTHPFNPENNSTNLMLGSWFATVMHLQINYYQPIGSNLGLRFGWGLTHISNGAFAQPNSGINSFFLTTGLYFKKERLEKPKLDSASRKPFSKGFDFLLSTSIALVEKFPVGGPKYFVFQIHGRSQYRIGRKSSFAIGLDWKRNNSVQAYIDENSDLGKSANVIGLPIGHELHISSVSMVTEIGFYIRKHHNVFPGIYQRYGLRKYWSDHCFTAIYLSTHKAKAECLEWTLGYKWK